jgi:hypothetical protein
LQAISIIHSDGHSLGADESQRSCEVDGQHCVIVARRAGGTPLCVAAARAEDSVAEATPSDKFFFRAVRCS